MDSRTLAINIVCFWWGRWCGELGPQYVNNLYKSVKKNVTLPYNFYCFTDAPSKLAVPTIEFTPKYKWNLNKFEAYNPIYRLEGKILTLDLDLIILDNIDDIADFKENLITCEGAYQKGKAGGSIVGAAVEYARKNIWDYFINNVDRVTNETDGSERFFFRHYLKDIEFFQHKYSGIYSYKRDCQQGSPDDARIIRFHGLPRPHEIKEWAI